MPKNVNTFTQFLPINGGGIPKVIVKNECYFSLIFLGGNYLSKGSLLQRIFGGRDDVSLIAGLRLQPDGLVINATEDPNIVLDKRSIKPGRVTNIPMVLNLMVKIPAYMDSIGFSFKIATTKRSDNFSTAMDVLNDAANKSVIESFIPNVVGKALGIGKVVKDMFDKIDQANNHDLIQLVVNDFIVPAIAENPNNNTMQEGYLILFVKDENPDGDQLESPENEGIDNRILLTEVNGVESEIDEGNSVFLDFGTFLENAQAGQINNLVYDEANKILKSNGQVVTNTYLVFKILKDESRGEDLSADWSKKYAAAVELLADEMVKTKAKLLELQPKVTELMVQGSALFNLDARFTPAEKKVIKNKYRVAINTEMAEFTS